MDSSSVFCCQSLILVCLFARMRDVSSHTSRPLRLLGVFPAALFGSGGGEVALQSSVDFRPWNPQRSACHLCKQEQGDDFSPTHPRKLLSKGLANVD
ncbi:hypothetical protein SADUNF_Sadunf01G0096500 [Salix dunnii]|uniref:Secreted protein n=1 Tax=Salix dunnii TaxID=1413687 RepID=A0A835NB05_9ROSI|nr:hypothetical protein SADUNF_Sadunf01G0096500 [Salix dunnii]